MSNRSRRGENIGNQTNNSNKHFSVPIQPFSGDPAVLEFFQMQIKDLCNINNYDNKKAIAFFRSHLTGAALNYYCTEPYFKENISLDEIFQKFKQYFRQSTPTFSIHELQNLQILPSESMYNLAHRLNTIISQVYPELTDEMARNTIKLKHFIAALPYSIKVIILKENIQNFNDAVKRAQQIQEIELSAAMTSVNSSNTQISHLNNEINALKAQINAITQEKPENKQKSVCQNGKQSHIKKHFSRNSNSRVFNNKNTYQKHKFRSFDRNGTCAFCGRNNHIMKNCREFLSIMNKSQQTYPKETYREPREYWNRNKQTQNARFPNVDAQTYNPHNLNF